MKLKRKRLAKKKKKRHSKGGVIRDGNTLSAIKTKLINMIPASDRNARASFEGETHAALVLSNGKLGLANYMGPGTHIIERIKRGDPPRTEADRVAQAHDIDYTLNPNDGRPADRRMIKRLNKILKQKTDNYYNVQIGKQVIQAKILAENAGLINRNVFTNGANVSDDNRQMLLLKSHELNKHFNN